MHLLDPGPYGAWTDDEASLGLYTLWAINVRRARQYGVGSAARRGTLPYIPSYPVSIYPCASKVHWELSRGVYLHLFLGDGRQFNGAEMVYQPAGLAFSDGERGCDEC